VTMSSMSVNPRVVASRRIVIDAVCFMGCMLEA